MTKLAFGHRLSVHDSGHSAEGVAHRAKRVGQRAWRMGQGAWRRGHGAWRKALEAWRLGWMTGGAFGFRRTVLISACPA